MIEQVNTSPHIIIKYGVNRWTRFQVTRVQRAAFVAENTVAARVIPQKMLATFVSKVLVSCSWNQGGMNSPWVMINHVADWELGVWGYKRVMEE